MRFPRLTSKLMIPAVFCFMLAGCTSQTTISELTGVFGEAAAAFAAVEGDNATSKQISTDTALAVAQINAWKPGTPSQNAVQAINLLIADINLIPKLSQQDQAYADIVLAAAGSVITFLEANSPSATGAKVYFTLLAPNNYTGPKINNAKDFKKQWNALVVSHPVHGLYKIK
jgi:hypothetical protein